MEFRVYDSSVTSKSDSSSSMTWQLDATHRLTRAMLWQLFGFVFVFKTFIVVILPIKVASELQCALWALSTYLHLWDKIGSMNSVPELVTVCSGDKLEALFYFSGACRMYDEYQARWAFIKSQKVVLCGSSQFVERRLIDRLFCWQFVSSKGSRVRFIDTACNVSSKLSSHPHRLGCRNLNSSLACRTLGGSDGAWCKLKPKIILKFPQAKRGCSCVPQAVWKFTIRAREFVFSLPEPLGWVCFQWPELIQ